MPFHVLVAPSGYKECLEADRVAAAIARGLRRGAPNIAVTELPLVDGGEGFAAALAHATGGELSRHIVTGPLGDRVEAVLARLGGIGARTFVVETAQAAGLRLVPRDRRDPMTTGTYGVGELIRVAIDEGAKRILVGCGDSGTNDGGAGMAQALGLDLLDETGAPIRPGCAGLATLARINLSRRDPRLKSVTIEAVCNIHNRLCGPAGVSRIFGPQKGALPRQVEAMDAAMTRYSAIIARDTGIAVEKVPGSGASGGMGAALHALLGATLRSRFDVVFDYFDLDARLASADLVFTAEGGIDLQTPSGKVPAEVGRRAKALGLPVIALAGRVDQAARVIYGHGIDAFFSVVQRPCEEAEAMAEAEALIELEAENVMRAVMIGMTLGEQTRKGQAS